MVQNKVVKDGLRDQLKQLKEHNGYAQCRDEYSYYD